jgi:hypothetical protein
MQTTFNAEYLIYETEGDSDPIEITVEGYADIEALKTEFQKIIRDSCKSYKVVGDEVRVTLTITNSSGEYIDHDEITLSIAEKDIFNEFRIIPSIKCCCGNDTFTAHQRAWHDVIVNSNGDFIEDKGVYESEPPYGPFYCTKCEMRYDELSELKYNYIEEDKSYA